ncbi:hypothetical protein DFH06DRAFT_1312570 [Mycena polygramma]|nr:hypothetical protein DFH06DRAFT_1312570 [Mycena polygramma]
MRIALHGRRLGLFRKRGTAATSRVGGAGGYTDGAADVVGHVSTEVNAHVVADLGLWPARSARPRPLFSGLYSLRPSQRVRREARSASLSPHRNSAGLKDGRRDAVARPEYGRRQPRGSGEIQVSTDRAASPIHVLSAHALRQNALRTSLELLNTGGSYTASRSSARWQLPVLRFRGIRVCKRAGVAPPTDTLPATPTALARRH